MFILFFHVFYLCIHHLNLSFCDSSSYFILHDAKKYCRIEEMGRKTRSKDITLQTIGISAIQALCPKGLSICLRNTRKRR